MANFKEVLIEALKRDGVKHLYSVNRGLMEVSKSTKRKSAFVKVAIDDEGATSVLAGRETAFIISFDGDFLNTLADELNKSEEEAKTNE